MLPAVLAGCATSDAYWRHLLWAILASTRNGMWHMIEFDRADMQILPASSEPIVPTSSTRSPGKIAWDLST